MSFELPKLDYAFDALEPHIDAKTMEIHHDKHHAAYTANLNAALTGTEGAENSIEDICKNISNYPPAVRNNGGGFFNHNLFWKVMAPNAGGNPSGELADAINTAFGSFDKFKEEFSKAGATRFGSGWAWMVVNAGKLEIGSTPNQDNPLMPGVGILGTPILGLDVWEHAYYLKYQNRRPDYMAAFWNVVNWKQVAEYYKAAK
jgi:superoxide dismutase, Fe-Mn family